MIEEGMLLFRVHEDDIVLLLKAGAISQNP